MIISLRGTNGSGKSTLVRAIMAEYESQTTVAYPDVSKRRPMGVICERTEGAGLFVPGHYQIDCGGIDTLPSLNCAYELVEQHAELGADVLMEGKNMTDSGSKLLAMWMQGADARVVHINTSLRVCVASVRSRGHKIAETTIRRLYDKSQREIDKLGAAGMTVFSGSREEAREEVRRWLSLI